MLKIKQKYKKIVKKMMKFKVKNNHKSSKRKKIKKMMINKIQAAYNNFQS